jgi:hypothetical protein
MDEQYILNLINTIQNQKNTLFNDLKNDTELVHSNVINSKLCALDAMLKSTFKLRNIIIKDKMSM